MRLTTSRSSLIFAAVSFLLLTACSLYSSGGRKALESNAFGLAGLKVAENFEACSTERLFPNETFLSETDQATVFSKASPLNVRVALKSQDFSCSYRFQSSEQLGDRLGYAIAATIEKSSGR